MLGGWFGTMRVVSDGQAGVLYRDGIFDRVLPPGRHRLSRRETLHLVTTAPQQAVVQGQEVLSRDGFQPRLSAVAEFAVTDPRLADAALAGGYEAAVHTDVQLALRDLALARPAEALLHTPRAELDAELLAAVAPSSHRLGVAMRSVRLRDVVLPADLRRLLTAVEKARREGQAAMERAHAEQAALRALANAARLLRNNPELHNLRLLQAVNGGPVTLVLGAPAAPSPTQSGPPPDP